MNKHNKEIFFISPEKVSGKDEIFVLKMKKDDFIRYIGDWSYNEDNIASARVFASKKDARLAMARLRKIPRYSDHEFFIERITRVIHYSVVESEAQKC